MVHVCCVCVVCACHTHRDAAEGLELQEGQVFGQLLRLQVVEQQRHLPLLAVVGLDPLAGFPRPVPLVAMETHC